MTPRSTHWARAGSCAALVGGLALLLPWVVAAPARDAGALPGPSAASVLGTGAATAPAEAVLPEVSTALDRRQPESFSQVPVGDRRSGIAIPKVGTRSATLQALSAEVGPAPVSVSIPALGVDARVIPVGVTASGQLEVPPTGAQIGWYEHGPVPGERGSAVLAGHVDFGGRPGTFFGLQHVPLGERVTVRYDDGSLQRFEVHARRRHAKSALPARRIFAFTGRPVVTLVTCGGAFDQAASSYTENVVVYATPVSAQEVGGSGSR